MYRNLKLGTPTSSKGFSLIELLVICTVVMITVGGIMIYINPVEQRQKVRDAKRLSDLGLLSQTIEQYVADNKNLPPDMENTLRSSNITSGTASASQSNGTGWIPIDLSGYTERLPVDPLNTGEFIYRYYRQGNVYKLDAKLEYYSVKMQNVADGGTSNCHYEVGTGLSPITLSGGC